jgi:anti-sigma factor (TIGR02949 family)
MFPKRRQEDDCGCRDAMRRLYDFLDGELDDDRRASIKRHLEQCVPCLQAFDFEAGLRVVIARKCRDQVPESLRTRVFHVAQLEVGPLDGTRPRPWA